MANANSDFVTADGLGPCPVSEDAIVEIVCRDGETATIPAGWRHSERDCQNSWRHNGGNCDIVRYRVIGASA